MDEGNQEILLPKTIQRPPPLQMGVRKSKIANYGKDR